MWIWIGMWVLILCWVNHENPSKESSRFSFVPEDLWPVRHRNSTCENGIASTFDNRVPVVKRSILLTLDLCGNETARWECVTSTDHISFTTILLRINYRVKWMPVFISPKASFHVFFLVLLYRRIPCESIHLLHILLFLNEYYMQNTCLDGPFSANITGSCFCWVCAGYY